MELDRTRDSELVIGRLDGALAACMYLHGEDRLFWPHVAQGEAFYVHRLAVARRFAGRGFAHAMLEWAEHEVRAKGRLYLRLDCEPRFHHGGFIERLHTARSGLVHNCISWFATRNPYYQATHSRETKLKGRPLAAF